MYVMPRTDYFLDLEALHADILIYMRLYHLEKRRKAGLCYAKAVYHFQISGIWYLIIHVASFVILIAHVESSLNYRPSFFNVERPFRYKIEVRLLSVRECKERKFILMYFSRAAAIRCLKVLSLNSPYVNCWDLISVYERVGFVQVFHKYLFS